MHDEVGFICEQKTMPVITLCIALNSLLFFLSLHLLFLSLSPPSLLPYPNAVMLFLLARVLIGVH